jgi:hypothetical protein
MKFDVNVILQKVPPPSHGLRFLLSKLPACLSVNFCRKSDASSAELGVVKGLKL